MEESTSKEKVLKKIRDALIEKTEAPFPLIDTDTSVYQSMEEPLDVTFAQELLKVSGKFVYCESDDEFLSVLQAFILEKDWPVIFCYDEKILLLYKKLCRYYWDIDPYATAFYINLYREMWDNENEIKP